MEYQELEAHVRKLTTESRFRHSKGVEEMAGRLAAHYGADVQKARLAGLLHDCVKNVDDCEKLRLAGQLGCKLDSVTLAEHKLIHAPLGAYYVREVLGIRDEEIFDAIYYHTTAKANMPLFTKILYIADVVEPNRKHDKTAYLRELAFQDLDKTILTVANFMIHKLVQTGKMLHPDTVNARNYLLSKGVCV